MLVWLVLGEDDVLIDLGLGFGYVLLLVVIVMLVCSIGVEW